MTLTQQQLRNRLEGALRSFSNRYGNRDEAFTSEAAFSSNGLGLALQGLPGEDGGDGTPMNVAERARTWFKRALTAAGGSTKEANALLVAAMQGGKDSAAARQLQAVRFETVDNTIWADAVLAPLFFDVVSLGPDEAPVIHSTSKQATYAMVMSEDGEPKRERLSAIKGETEVDLHYIATPKVSYKPRDIYSGNAAAAMLGTLDLSYDLAEKMDDEALTLLESSLGAWSNDGSNKALRTFVSRGAIASGNLPTTNDLVLSDNTADTKFRIDVFDAVETYCQSWGKAFRDLPGGTLMPTGVVVVPSSEVTAILSSIGISSSATNRTAQEIQGNYLTFWRGRQWTIVPSNRLAPGKCWAQLNARVGTIYTKASHDREIDTGLSDEAWQKNSAYRQMWKVATPYIIEAHKPRALRVTYTS